MLFSTKIFVINQQNFCNYSFFIIDKMASRAGWNGFMGHIWPTGRSLETLV